MQTQPEMSLRKVIVIGTLLGTAMGMVVGVIRMTMFQVPASVVLVALTLWNGGIAYAIADDET